jgi:hypothetical protein
MPRQPENPEKGENPPANDPSAGEPVVDQVLESKREDWPPPDITLKELAAMFRSAAVNGPCPTEEMLKAFPRLQRFGWVEKMRKFSLHQKSKIEEAEAEVRQAMRQLHKNLPTVINFYRKIASLGLPAFDPITKIEPLIMLYGAIPEAQSALFPEHVRERVADWHAPAEVIAVDAMEAWRLSGRVRFGANDTSPLVKFTKDFLDRCGGEPRTDRAIAGAFQRGIVGRVAKRHTQKNL